MPFFVFQSQQNCRTWIKFFHNGHVVLNCLSNSSLSRLPILLDQRSELNCMCELVAQHLLSVASQPGNVPMQFTVLSSRHRTALYVLVQQVGLTQVYRECVQLLDTADKTETGRDLEPNNCDNFSTPNLNVSYITCLHPDWVLGQKQHHQHLAVLPAFDPTHADSKHYGTTYATSLCYLKTLKINLIHCPNASNRLPW